MDTRKLIDTMGIAENLKNYTRHSWTSTLRQESVAEHSWRLSLLAYFVSDEFPQADINKVIQMCIFHDMGEAFTGDIPAFNKTENHEKIEIEKLYSWIDSLPDPYNKKVRDLFIEMDEQKTIESKIYKALDKMEVVLQHNEAPLSTWIPLEYTLNIDHSSEQVEFSNYLKKLKKELNNDSINKIQATYLI